MSRTERPRASSSTALAMAPGPLARSWPALEGPGPPRRRARAGPVRARHVFRSRGPPRGSGAWRASPAPTAGRMTAAVPRSARMKSFWTPAWPAACIEPRKPLRCGAVGSALRQVEKRQSVAGDPSRTTGVRRRDIPGRAPPASSSAKSKVQSPVDGWSCSPT
jgi:hypothetical protein